MKNDKLEKVLTDLGLSEHEAKVYLSALSLGPASILDIARSAQVKRTTVYSVIEALQQQGLMNIEVQGLKKQFVAEDPEHLEGMVSLRKEILKRALPELSALYNLKGEESIIKYYHGMEGVKVVYDTILDDMKPRDDFMVITDQERFVGLDQEYFTGFIARRRKMNTTMRLLMQDSPIAHKQQQERIPHETIKILPKGEPLTTDLVITPHQVIILQLIPPITTLVVSSKSIVQLHKELFEIIWRSIPDAV